MLLQRSLDHLSRFVLVGQLREEREAALLKVDVCGKPRSKVNFVSLFATFTTENDVDV